VLGGLISSEDSNTSDKVPGLGHLPVIGRLFGNNNGTVNKTEIVMAITPHILRAPATLDASVRSVFSGTESSLRERALQLDPIGSVRAQSTGGPASVTLPQPGRAPAAAPAPVAAPPAVSSPPGPASVPAAVADTAAQPSRPPPPPSGTGVRALLPLMNQARGAGAQPAAASEPAASAPADGEAKAPQ
jgi:general secretion pathway protein D